MSTQRAIRRVLVVYKTSPYARYLQTGALDEFEGGDGQRREILGRLRRADEANQRTIRQVRLVLGGAGLEIREPSAPTKKDAAWADLVLSVGGDGTFLRVSHRVERTPMLGVNSAPNSSVGHYCATDAEGFEATLDRIRAGEEPLVELSRIGVRIGRRRLPHHALNDALVSHRLPAASSRYILTLGSDSEVQTSSGIWIATSSGSTGAIRSAGGEPMTAADRRLQFRVREPFLRPGEILRLGEGATDEPLEILARSDHLGVMLDGHGPCHGVRLGERIVVSRSDRPLRVYGYRPAWT